jgi:hypothetical protein
MAQGGNIDKVTAYFGLQHSNMDIFISEYRVSKGFKINRADVKLTLDSFILILLV